MRPSRGPASWCPAASRCPRASVIVGRYPVRRSATTRRRGGRPSLRRVRTDRGLDRLVTFLDAVVAIAITLLVLPLVDVIPDEGRDVDLGALLADEAGRFGAFALSFAVIAQLWLVHHRIEIGRAHV